MHDIVDLETYPRDRPEGMAYQTLVTRCRDALAREGMFNLDSAC